MGDIVIFGRTITSEQIRLAILGLCVLIAAFMFWNTDVPKLQSWLELRSQIDQNSKELDAAQALTATEPQIRDRLARVQTNLATLRSRFPPRNQILSVLLVDLSRIFQNSRNTMTSFQPREFTTFSQASLRDLGKISIDITAKGNYPTILLLLDQLSRYERVLTIENPQLTPAGSGGLNNDLTMSFTLTTYAINQ